MTSMKMNNFFNKILDNFNTMYIFNNIEWI